jgi:hypothetical protein
MDQVEHGHVEVDEDWREKDGIEAVEDASVTRDQVRLILDLGDPLHLGLDEIADKGADANQEADQDGVQRR